MLLHVSFAGVMYFGLRGEGGGNWEGMESLESNFLRQISYF